MHSLVIVESPAKAKTIRKYLGSGFEVKASMGHIRDLFPTKLSVDVNHDFEPAYTVIKGKEKLLQELRDAAAKSDRVFLATDPDREGEAISWHLATLLGLDLNQKNRVKFNEINKRSVLAGIANPSEIDVDLVNAQQARRILDRLVGYKLSPFISQKIRRGLSAGRVQSVALRLIVDREEEIAAFKPEEYWTIGAVMYAPPAKRQIKAEFVGDENGKIDLHNEEETNAILARLEDAAYSVKSVKKGVRSRTPAPPFITSTLQQEASKQLGFTAKRTMRIAQELYEGVEVEGVGSVGLITYMRTDSLRISEESRADGNAYIREQYGERYLPEKPRYYKSKANAQDGHEAIRPTTVSLTPEAVKSSLTGEQHRLYTLIWRRFIASLMANSVQDTVKAEIIAEQEGRDGYILFAASGYSVRFDGYTALYDDAAEEAGAALPEMKDGNRIKLRDLNPEQHFTQPPQRYTEASLIKMLEETGVGRPSTYATILSTIVDREYVTRQSKKSLAPTELGVAITHLLEEKFPKIVNTKFTAGMEADLDKIEAGGYDYVKMLHSFYDEFEETLKKAKSSMEGVKIQLAEDVTDIPCEKCGAMMVVKVSRYGKFLACPNYPACQCTKPFVKPTEGKCPVCGGDCVSKKTRHGRVFYGCSNYPDCRFMTWDTPTAETCPKCGKTLFRSRGNKLKCLDENCGYSATGNKKENEG
ncbi:MAG: type I DNA topoisomerase [Clostridia bacterium]|nr:type I DNA topoisomerase [Clostridia bacterium]MBR0536668.1 type I DNA topoisomerase [Clostridia bacterium]